MRTTALGIVMAGSALPFLLGACGTAGTDTSAPVDATQTTAAATPSTSTPSVTPSPKATESTASAEPTPAAPTKTTRATPTPAPAQGTPRCHTADLSARLGTKSGTGQTTVPIVYTNTSGHTCSLHGFGGVDLHGPDDATFGPVYSLPRRQATPTTFHLAPGGHAHLVITYLLDRGQAARSSHWQPTTVVVTPPDETTSLTMPWTTGDAVMRQDGATHPGTFIGPVTPGV